jgi:hypothetical protein
VLLDVDGDRREFRVLAAPPEVQRRLDELCRVAGVSARPELVWCDELGGRGGVSGGGMIAIGAREQLENAARVARELGCDPVSAERAALDVALAHELGHAAMHARGIEHEEEHADAWALSACELAGWRTPVHDAVARVIKDNRAVNRARPTAFADGLPFALGQATCSIAAVRGIEKTSPNFRAKLIQVASGIGINPDWLAAVISFESNGTFSPSVKNPSSGATGIIQFTRGTAISLGTTTDALARMTAEQQLDYVDKYYDHYRGRLGSLCSTYAVVFAGHCVGASPDTVAYSAPSSAYEQNRGLDFDGDGAITCREVCAAVQGVLSSAGSRRVEAPCSPVSVGGGRGGFGAGALLVGAALVGGAFYLARQRGVFS